MALNNEIHEALEKICIEKNIGENTRKKIKDYLDLLSIGGMNKSETDTRIQNILEGMQNGA